MSALARSGGDVVSTVGRAASEAPDLREFAMLAKLAGFWARPIGHVDATRLDLPPLGADAVNAMARHSAFREPINAAIADHLGLGRGVITPSFLAALATSPAHQLVVMLLTEPVAAVDRFARMIAAAILARRISGLVLKTDRQRAREALGDDAFRVATEEAPLMYAGLAELDMKSPGGGLLETTEAIIRFSRAALGRFCDTVAPELADFFELRFPLDPTFVRRAEAIGSFRQHHIDQALRLVRRKEPAWLAPIV